MSKIVKHPAKDRKVSLPTDPDSPPVTVSIPQAVHRYAMAAALLEGVALDRWIEDALLSAAEGLFEDQPVEVGRLRDRLAQR